MARHKLLANLQQAVVANLQQAVVANLQQAVVAQPATRQPIVEARNTKEMLLDGSLSRFKHDQEEIIDKLIRSLEHIKIYEHYTATEHEKNIMRFVNDVISRRDTGLIVGDNIWTCMDRLIAILDASHH
jgi:hypothetical protein